MSILEKFFQGDEAPADKKPAIKRPAGAPAVAEKPAKRSRTKKVTAASNVLIRPVVTEKASRLASHNQYVFAVNRRANKVTVAAAIAVAYGVEPIAVHILNVRGKLRKRRNASGFTSAWKKAIVTLPKGKSITIIEGI